MPRTVKPSDLGAVLRAHERNSRKAVLRGVRRATYAGKRHLMQAAKEAGKTDRGQFRNSFRVLRTGSISLKRMGGYEILNDAPYAGVIELGARPHPVSPEGVQSIYRWVYRKLLGISAAMAEENAEVDAITQAIVRKLRLYGQRGTFLFRNALSTLQQILKREVERAKKEDG